MSRGLLMGKDTGASTFYNTSNSETLPFAIKRKLLSANAEAMDVLCVEVDGKMDKLREKIAVDEGKIGHNYEQLQLLQQEMADSCQKMLNDRQAESEGRGRRERVKAAFEESKGRNAVLSQRWGQEVSLLREGVQSVERDKQREKQQRDSKLMQLIDEFEGEMVGVERQLAAIRAGEKEVFQGWEVGIYNLEQEWVGRLQGEVRDRQHEHETIIKLVGQCIQHFSFIY